MRHSGTVRNYTAHTVYRIATLVFLVLNYCLSLSNPLVLDAYGSVEMYIISTSLSFILLSKHDSNKVLSHQKPHASRNSFAPTLEHPNNHCKLKTLRLSIQIV